MQKKIIRNITNSDYLTHAAPFFNQLQLLNIDKLRKYSLGVYLYKNIRTLLPELQYLHNHFTRNRHRSRPEHHNKTIYERSFVFQAPKLWNELLNHGLNINRNGTSLNAFKRLLNQFLLNH